jgi:DNA-directed RNA polymerase beta' subunit
MNKLLRRGWTAKSASKLIFDHVHTYHPVIDECLKEMISESKWKGLPIKLQRNPSLLPGSSQDKYITQFKPVVTDLTISISTLVVGPYNADFDGDELNAMIMLDNEMTEHLQKLNTHYSATNMDKPYNVSGKAISLLAPSTITISNYLSTETNNGHLDTLSNRLLDAAKHHGNEHIVDDGKYKQRLDVLKRMTGPNS